MGNLEGFFTKFPNHLQEPYNPHTDYKPSKKIVNNSGKLFTPQQGPKSKPQTSIINQNITVKINANNFKKADSFATYNLRAVSTM